MAVIPKTAVGTHESLIVPVLKELMQEGVPVHSQRPTDALHATKVGLASPLNVEGHPVPYTAQEGDPRLVLVQDLGRNWNKINVIDMTGSVCKENWHLQEIGKYSEIYN